MIGRLNHVAIAVPDLEAAAAQYRGTLGATVGAPQAEPDHGVTVVFIDLPNTKIELLQPLGEASPILGFLEKNAHLNVLNKDLKRNEGFIRSLSERELSGDERREIIDNVLNKRKLNEV